MRAPLAALVLAALLAGCSPLTTREPPPEAWRLHGADFRMPNPVELPAATVLAAPALPGVLEGDRIVLYSGPQQVSHYAGVRWAAPLRELIHRALIEALQPHTGPGIDPALARSGSHELRVVIGEFQPVYPPGADPAGAAPPELRVALALALVETRSGRILAASRAEGRQPAAANRIGAVTAGLNQLLMESFAEALAGLGPPQASSR